MSELKGLRGSPGLLDNRGPLCSLYQRLLADPDGESNKLSDDLLRQQLEVIRNDCSQLPEHPGQLMSWVERNCTAVALEYCCYLKARQQGGARRYFRNRAHALYFLQGVAPTKQVDGAWLYGVLEHWQDHRYDGLIITYLEELGDGEPTQNHVAIYRRLLVEFGCDSNVGLPDELFLQGTIQLALGQCARNYMPEVLGYNLGYEQLPLHLLISAYELAELGIDPYYFSLHVTIDNASTGHAHRAVQGVLELMPRGMDGDRFWQRVQQGYRLNNVGPGSIAVIQSFDLEAELVRMLERKSPFGQHMHSDYCRFEGKSVNQWLAHPVQIPAFLQALQGKGWIVRHQNPTDSRFWHLIEGAGAARFGVFSGLEKQLLHDWSAGDWSSQQRVIPVRRGPLTECSPLPNQVEDPETQVLRTALANEPVEREFALLLPWLGPQRHHRPAGLFATRRFIELRARLG